MNPRIYWALGLSGGAAALIITRMGFHAQERQYSKTLAYMKRPQEWGRDPERR
jgi:hypothetical protein